jgi:hypothetical protein
MLPQPPAVVKCGIGAECYWLKDAREIGVVKPWGDEEQQVDAAWRAAQPVQEPDEDEYYEALAGASPAFPVERVDAQAILRDGTRGTSEGRRSRHLRGAGGGANSALRRPARRGWVTDP